MAIWRSSARRHLRRAWTAYQCGDVDRTLDECGAALTADPGNFEARLLGARTLVMTKQDGEADAALRTIIADYPGRAQPHKLLAAIAFRRRDVAAGVAQFKASPRYVGGTVAAGLELAALLRANECIASAKETLVALRTAYPNRIDVLSELAKCAYFMGEIEQAADYCGDALSLQPDNLAVRTLRAQIDRRQGRDGDAWSWLEPVASRPDDPPDAVIERAELLNLLGDHETARGEWERAHILAPNSARATRNLAGTLLKIDALDRAAELTAEATRQGPRLAWLIAAAIELFDGYRMRGGAGGNRAKARKWEKRAAALKSLTWQMRADAVMERARRRLEEMRSTAAATLIRETAPDRVTLMCPIHRPGDLDNALMQLQRQTYPNIEVVIALHRTEIATADVERRWSSPWPLHVLRCEHEEYVSQVQMACLAASGGDIVVEIDADDIYLPNYATDMVITMDHFGADVLGKRGHFRYYEASDSLFLESPHSNLCRADRPGTGATICARRDVANAVGFDTRYRDWQDRLFYRHAMGSGYRVFHADSFNHIVIRRADTASHTWRQLDVNGIPSDAIYIGGRGAFPRVEI